LVTYKKLYQDARSAKYKIVKQVGKNAYIFTFRKIYYSIQTPNPVFTPSVTERGLLCAHYPQSKIEVLENIAFRTVQSILLLSTRICVFSKHKTPHLPR